MMRIAIRLVNGVAGVPLLNLHHSRRQSRRQPSRFWYEDAHTWKIVVCTWAAASQAMVRARYFLGGDDGAVDPTSGNWRPVHRRGHDAVSRQRIPQCL